MPDLTLLDEGSFEGPSFDTASVSVTAGDKIVLKVFASGPANDPFPPVGFGATWTREDNPASFPNEPIQCWTCTAPSTTTGAVTWDADTTDVFWQQWHLYRSPNAGDALQTAKSDTNPELGSALTADSTVLATWGAAGTDVIATLPGAEWTETARTYEVTYFNMETVGAVSDAPVSYAISRAGAFFARALAIEFEEVAGGGPTYGELSGSASASLSTSGALTATGELSGSASAALSTSGALSATGALSGSATAALSTSGTVTATGELSGSATAALTTSGTLVAYGDLSGSASATLATSGNLTDANAGDISGSASATLTTSGTLSAWGELSGSATVSLSTSGQLVGTGNLSGSASASLSTSGALVGWGALSGSATATLTATGRLSGGIEDDPLPEITVTAAIRAAGFSVTAAAVRASGITVTAAIRGT